MVHEVGATTAISTHMVQEVGAKTAAGPCNNGSTDDGTNDGHTNNDDTLTAHATRASVWHDGLMAIQIHLKGSMYYWKMM